MNAGELKNRNFRGMELAFNNVASIVVTHAIGRRETNYKNAPIALARSVRRNPSRANL